MLEILQYSCFHIGLFLKSNLCAVTGSYCLPDHENVCSCIFSLIFLPIPYEIEKILYHSLKELPSMS